jgi:tripartite-type tricarboxylate transporter receptor subunit TctC
VRKGTPAAIVAKLADALEKTMADKELTDSMNEVGAGVVFLRGSEAKEFLARQDATYRKIIEDLGLRVVPAR